LIPEEGAELDTTRSARFPGSFLQIFFSHVVHITFIMNVLIIGLAFLVFCSLDSLLPITFFAVLAFDSTTACDRPSGSQCLKNMCKMCTSNKTWPGSFGVFIIRGLVQGESIQVCS
jgi:hypothetical protein